MSVIPFSARLRGWILRHRASLNDAAMLAGVLLVASYVALSIEIFRSEKTISRGRLALDLNEVLLMGSLLSIGLALFAARRVFEQKREVKRRVAAEQDARDLAYQDSLTGLANRRSFDEALRRAMAAPPGGALVHAVLVLDLNGFKRINDIFGHAAGDEVLVVVGRRLAALVRGEDLVARLGGDEFAILAHHLTGPEAANSLGLRISHALEGPITVAGVEHVVGAGIGVSVSPTDATNPAELLRKADIALYRAKGEGRFSVRFFKEEMDAHLRERDVIERELRNAIGTEALQPYYQPLVDLQSGRVVGFEALARWNHPTMGSIPPDRFISIAEDTGLIRDLTSTLLHRACQDAVTWPLDVTLSFNISPVELRDSTLGLRIMTILGVTGLAPNRLELEITESALVRDMKAAQETLGALHDAGIRIALDDFGTGCSSLYHLRNFKLDKIKIDRSFVAAMESEAESGAIVKALLGLGRGLGLTVTAEGVETDLQAAALRADGCNQGQGFLYGRALIADEALALLKPEARKCG